ncbi:hypothetical protein [Streptococcus massiliensis]|uniref:ATP-binding cassette lipoprotein n=1 Tax=Streptococcus massiliensis TaxID=313439 RepID=A0A380L0X2_9STRE|nr:hypothetical protein [Streptococcus massiliensis]SUN77526.1 ATP-binding cassette lipoprotein [Streptococcus massiliensis]
MNSKKMTATAALLLAASIFLGACGQKQTDNKSQNKKQVSLKKDAVDQKTKVVDGKEITEYTMSDGAVVQVPKDVEEEAENADNSNNN